MTARQAANAQVSWFCLSCWGEGGRRRRAAALLAARGWAAAGRARERCWLRRDRLKAAAPPSGGRRGGVFRGTPWNDREKNRCHMKASKRNNTRSEKVRTASRSSQLGVHQNKASSGTVSPTLRPLATPRRWRPRQRLTFALATDRDLVTTGLPVYESAPLRSACQPDLLTSDLETGGPSLPPGLQLAAQIGTRDQHETIHERIPRPVRSERLFKGYSLTVLLKIFGLFALFVDSAFCPKTDPTGTSWRRFGTISWDAACSSSIQEQGSPRRRLPRDGPHSSHPFIVTV